MEKLRLWWLDRRIHARNRPGQEAAIQALRTMRTPGAWEILAHFESDFDWKITIARIEALIDMANHLNQEALPVPPALNSWLTHDCPGVALLAKDLIPRLDTKEYFHSIAKTSSCGPLMDPQRNAGIYALLVLKESGAQSHIDDLAFSAQSSAIRQRAIAAMSPDRLSQCFNCHFEDASVFNSTFFHTPFYTPPLAEQRPMEDALRAAERLAHCGREKEWIAQRLVSAVRQLSSSEGCGHHTIKRTIEVIATASLSALADLLTHTDASIRNRAAIVLARRDDTRAIPGILRLLGDMNPRAPLRQTLSDWNDLRIVFDFLVKHGAVEAVQPMIELLQRPSADVPGTGAGQGTETPPISGYERLFMLVVRALGEVRHADAIPVLVSIIVDAEGPDSWVPESGAPLAIEALEKIMRKHRPHASTQDLESICDLAESYDRLDRNISRVQSTSRKTVQLDCRTLKVLASAELARRKVAAPLRLVGARFGPE